MIYFNVIVSRVLACQGLTHIFTKNETALTHTYIFKESQPGNTSPPYLLTLIKGMTHMYPNGTNFPIEAAKLFWEFFKQSTKVSTDETSKSCNSITAFPNPFQDKMEFRLNDISLASPYEITVLNSVGIPVYEQSGKWLDRFLLDKASVGSGLFILRIQSGRHVASEKFIFE